MRSGKCALVVYMAAGKLNTTVKTKLTGQRFMNKRNDTSFQSTFRSGLNCSLSLFIV